MTKPKDLKDLQAMQAYKASQPKSELERLRAANYVLACELVEAQAQLKLSRTEQSIARLEEVRAMLALRERQANALADELAPHWGCKCGSVRPIERPCELYKSGYDCMCDTCCHQYECHTEAQNTSATPRRGR